MPDVESFGALVGQGFTVGEPGPTLPLVLASVTTLVAGPMPSRPGFSLLFRSGSSDVLPQSIHTLTHAAMGPLAVFLVPLGPDEQGMRYEAIFN